MKFIFVLFLLIGCVKYPCVIVVDVNIINGGNASAIKKTRCGDIYFPFNNNTATKVNSGFIEINFFQGARVVLADAVHNFDSVYKWEYIFPDTNPDLMIWRVYKYDQSGYVQYETKIK